MVPSGDTPEIVEQYYEYLLQHYINPLAQNTGLNWIIVAVTLGWVAIVAALFFIYFRRSRSEKPSQLYPVETYNGYISESNAGTGTFLFIFFALVVLWLLYTTISDLTMGQIY
jgi:hypothetical protein